MNSNTADPRISVAMATYNGEKYLREQLDSIARQDLLPLELVITDDGSTDATLQIVDDFARHAPFPVRNFRNDTRLGFADNFLKAASLCQGDLIAFCDQDDIWMENKLSICAALFRDPRVSLAIHSARIITPSGQQAGYFPGFSTTKMLSPSTCDPFAHVHGFAMVVRKYLLHISDNSRRPSRFYGHDHWLWFLAAGAGRIATIADVLTLYRQHGSNAFGAPRARSLLQRAKNFAGTFDYNRNAELELDCARLLREAADRNPEYAHRLERSAEMFELQSKLHSIRNRIYSRESTLFGRASAFMHILALAGYLPGRSKTRLGLRDAAKDLVIGIPAGNRLFALQAASPKES